MCSYFNYWPKKAETDRESAVYKTFIQAKYFVPERCRSHIIEIKKKNVFSRYVSRCSVYSRKRWSDHIAVFDTVFIGVAL